MEQLKGKVVVAQGGGPTAVINHSLVGVALEARKYGFMTHVYGARHGVRGIVNEDFLNLSQATSHNLEMVAITPSSALGSTRDKPDEAYCQRIVDVFKKHDVRYFFYIGGNDSAETCRLVSNASDQMGYELRVIHVPKTIDNDLLVTDHCPGFGSAAKFVISAFVGLDLDNYAIPGVFVGVVMGRSSGFLTASSLIARRTEEAGPHLIYVPEQAFNTDRFLDDVDRIYSRLGRCVVAVSEGIQDETGTPMLLRLTQDMDRDPFGNIQLSGRGTLGDALADAIKGRLKIRRIRCDTFGYLQRSFLGMISEVDASEARDVGECAVQFAVWQQRNGSVAIKRTGDYTADYFLTDIENVAAGTKLLAPEFLDGSSDIHDAYKSYVRPLLGHMPHFDKLIAPPVDKL